MTVAASFIIRHDLASRRRRIATNPTSRRRFRTKEELGLPKWVAAVEGTVDDPPIVIWQDRLKVSAMSLALAVLAAIFYGMGSGSAARVFWPILLGMTAALFGWMAIVRNCLILTPEGLTWRTAFHTFNYEWSDFERFVVALGRTKMVAGVLSESYKRRQSWFWHWTGRWMFGGFWELPQQQIVDVLNRARTHWGPPRKAL